jgi:hypothetical protein
VRHRKDTRSGWKAAFWSAAAVTVGLGVGIAVTGISVLDLETDKKTEIYRLLNSPEVTLTPEVEREITVGDACKVAKDASFALQDICNDGPTRAGIVNGLVAGGAVSAAITAFFLYKAYIQKRPAPARTEEDADEDAEARRRIRLNTAAGPYGGQVGLSVSF